MPKNKVFGQAGGVTYLLHIFSDGTAIDIHGLFGWIIGYHTWLYYVPVVLSCYFVFNFSDKIAYIITISLVSLISYILTCLGLLNETTIIMTSCQNPMNWIWLFGLGVILNKLGIKKPKLSFNNHNKLQLSTIVYGVFWIMMVVIYFNISRQYSFTPSYWNCISVLFELTTVVFFYLLSMMLVEKYPPIKLFEQGRLSENSDNLI